MSSINTNFVDEENTIYEENLDLEVSCYFIYIYLLSKLYNNKNYYTVFQPSLSELEESAEVYITRHMTVKTIIHSLTPIEYPPTSECGVAIVYHIEGWNNVNAAFSDVSII